MLKACGSYCVSLFDCSESEPEKICRRFKEFLLNWSEVSYPEINGTNNFAIWLDRWNTRPWRLNPIRCRRVAVLWRLYQAAVMELDDGVGRVLGALEDLGLANHTLGHYWLVVDYESNFSFWTHSIPCLQCCTRVTTGTCCLATECSANNSCWSSLCAFLYWCGGPVSFHLVCRVELIVVCKTWFMGGWFFTKHLWATGREIHLLLQKALIFVAAFANCPQVGGRLYPVG